MPILNVFDTQGTMRLDAAAIVFSTMLCPGIGEEERRLDQLARERFNARQHGLVAHIPPEDLFRIAEASRRGDDLRRFAKKRQKLGWRAGHMACNVIRLIAATGPRASLNGASVLSGAVARPRLRPEMLQQRAWGPMRPAIHLWCALYIAEHMDAASQDWARDHAALARLLRTAESARMVFEAFRADNAKGPLVPAGTAWRLPITFLDPLDWLMSALRDREHDLIEGQRAENRKPA